MSYTVDHPAGYSGKPAKCCPKWGQCLSAHRPKAVPCAEPSSALAAARSLPPAVFRSCSCPLLAVAQTGTSGGSRIHPERPPSVRRQTTPHLPVEIRLAAVKAPPREGLHALSVIEKGNTRQGFRRGIAPGTTRIRQRSEDCLAPSPPGSRRLLLAPRSQSSAFESPGDHSGHRGDYPRPPSTFPG